MIIQKEPDMKVLKEEFKKGNIYNVAIDKKTKKENDIAIIKKIVKNEMWYDDYIITDNYRFDEGYDIDICDDWNWTNCDYCILTPEEARPYLKEIMVATLSKIK